MEDGKTRIAAFRRVGPLLACAISGAALFQFYGNANLGYIDTRSLFYWWGFQWSNEASEAQHGWLILALSGWLFWRNLKWTADPRWTALLPSAVPTARWGAARATSILAAALALHAIGFAVQQARLSILALLLFVYGVARLADATPPSDRRPARPPDRLSRAAVFPLAFMVFAIPLNVLDSVGFWLRMGVVRVSAGLAHLCGIGVLRSGTLLLAPDGRYQYDVAAACSGVRSLMALAALSLLLGYIGLGSNRLRGLVFAACFPLVFLGNVARISAIIFAAQWGGPAWGDRAHDIMGWGIFAIVLGGVYALAAWLRRFDPSDVGAALAPPDPPIVRAPTSGAPMSGAESALGSSALHLRVPIAIIALIGLEMIALHWLTLQPPRGEAGVRLMADGVNPVDLPAILGRGEWIGRPREVSQVEREILPPDTGYSRREYVSLARPGQAVFLSIVLSGRDRTSIHRPELCLVGQGWTIRSATTHAFADRSDPARGVTAAVLRVEREIAGSGGPVVVPQLVAYWFVSSDATVSSHWARILRDAWSRLIHLRADRWAYVLLQTNADDGEAAALARMQSILDETLPAFRR